jgi:HNH endonuclease
MRGIQNMKRYEKVELEHVRRAMDDYESLGEEEFLKRYEFGKPTRYYLVDRGRSYPPKAIAGVANGYATGDFLTGQTSMGGRSGANKLFRRLGLRIIPIKDFQEPKRSGDSGRNDAQKVTEKLPDGISDFVPSNIEDARKMISQTIAARQGQAAFRKKLMEAYRGACAITNSKISSVLQAAHIIPFKGLETNHVQNGLLLRADIHDLFDLGLINIDPEGYVIRLSMELKGSEYSEYEGVQINLPAEISSQPNKEALKNRCNHNQ